MAVLSQSDHDVATRVVFMVGEFDVATSPRFEREVLAALGAGVSAVVVDASQVEFIDASGIGVLVGVANRVRELGGRLVLRNPSKPTRRLLDLLGLDGALPVEQPPD